MGLNSALDIADMNITLEQQLAMHFRGNCYPPVPLIMITPAMEAIDAYWEMDYNKLINLPDGIEFKNGATKLPATQLIDSLRLEAWCFEDDDFEEFEE